MNPTKTLLSLIVAFAAGASAHAQNVTVTSDAAGLLGKRYAEASFGFLDANRNGGDVYGAGVNVNLPVADTYDVGIAYAYAWLDDNNDIDASALDASFTAYFSQGALKPFGTVSLGYQWADSDDTTLWGADVGVEYNVNAQLSLIVSAGYDDDFESGDNGEWDGTVSGHYAINEKIGARLSASLIEGGHIAYSAGVTFKF